MSCLACRPMMLSIVTILLTEVVWPQFVTEVFRGAVSTLVWEK